MSTELQKKVDNVLFTYPVITPVSENDQLASLTTLAGVFAPSSSDRFNANLRMQLEISPQQVIDDPDHYPVSAQVYQTMGPEGQTAALGVLKYYAWKRIREQIYVASDMVSVEDALKLTQFQNLWANADLKDPVVAVELAYNYVDPQFRRKGYGRHMFDGRLQMLQKLSLSSFLVFLIARGQPRKQMGSSFVFNCLLDAEKRKNGTNAEGKVIITGTPVAKEELLACLNLPKDYELERVDPTAQPTVAFAVSHNMQKLGYFQNMAPVYGRVFKSQELG